MHRAFYSPTSHQNHSWLRVALTLAGILLLVTASPASGEQPATDSQAQQIEQLRAMVLRLQDRVDALENQVNGQRQPVAFRTASLLEPVTGASLGPGSPAATPPSPVNIATNVPVSPVQPVRHQETQPQTSAAPQVSSAASLLPTTLPGGATLNLLFDGYYEYNFNQPPGRVNYLRAYDVLSNVFSINQADLMLDWQPDVANGRRFGGRLDLQFGQATDTLQGNPVNEPRPSIYRNIFQAYGTYILPVGSGLNVDFGKWASSLGAEGNYTKDQMNYTRSFYFYYLPFYHQGFRVSYAINDKLKANYWLVNGTNQSEPTNGFKDEMFGFALTPAKTVTWTSNYYFGQEHPDFAPASNCTVPVQPGLCVQPLQPALNGKVHIFDNYATWQVTPKLTLQGEGDYVIQRNWASAAPGRSSAPSHVSGGAAYVQYQLSDKGSIASRAEYLSDPQALFSGKGQALKEWTGTYKYSFGNGFDTFLEYRVDWSNQPYFLTHNLGSPSQHQQTTTLGLVWWYGGKQGSW